MIFVLVDLIWRSDSVDREEQREEELSTLLCVSREASAAIRGRFRGFFPTFVYCW